MAKRFTDTQIWNKEWFLKLNIKEKLLLKFLFDNCDCAGIYETNLTLLSVFMGETITDDDFKNLKQVRKLENGNYLIEDFIKFQYGVSINELNPKFSVHRGIIKQLEKNNITLNQPLLNPCVRVTQTLQDKDKDKYMDKDNISTNSIKEKENKKEKEKIDPYFSSAKSNFLNEWQKVFDETPYLQRQHCFKLIELEEDIENFREILPDALQKLKRLKFDDIDFNPQNADWILRDCNFSKLMNGAFDNQLEVKHKSIAEILAEIEEKKSG